MWIAGENVGGNVFGEIPPTGSIANGEIDRREIARVISILRTDNDRHHIANMHSHIFLLCDLHDHTTARLTSNKLLSRAPTPDFKRPTHTVATFGMRVLNFPFELKYTGDGALPRHHCTHRRRGMHRNTVRLHRARHTHLLVRTIGNHAQSVVTSPPLDEVVVATAIDTCKQRRTNRHFARSANAQTIQPR